MMRRILMIAICSVPLDKVVNLHFCQRYRGTRRWKRCRRKQSIQDGTHRTGVPVSNETIVDNSRKSRSTLDTRITTVDLGCATPNISGELRMTKAASPAKTQKSARKPTSAKKPITKPTSTRKPAKKASARRITRSKKA
jgi:hypothetical protein